MSTRTRVAALALLVVGAVVALIIVSSSSDDSKDTNSSSAATTTSNGTKTGNTSAGGNPTPATTPLVTRIAVENGKPVGGVKKITVNKGERVRLAVSSDVADEIHVHGYDLMKDVDAGGTVNFSFKADIDGGYEIELEDHKQQIAELEVQP
jgi:hypothetical protein